MSCPGGGWLAELGLALGMLASSLAVQAQGSPLAQRVQPTPGYRPLGAVLRELSRQSQLPLSYSSSLVPLSHRCRVRPGPPRPLNTVLREVLGAEHLRYDLLAGQLVLWPDHAAAPPGVRAVAGQPGVASRPQESTHSARLPSPRASRPAEVAAKAGETTAGLTAVRSAAPATQSMASTPVAATSAPLATKGISPTQRARQASSRHSPRHASPTAVPLGGAPTGQASTRATRSAAPASLSRPAAGTAPTRVALGQSLNTRGVVAPLLPRPAGLLVALPSRPDLLPLRTENLVSAASPTKAPVATSNRARGLYLHGEAWLSESLPVGLTGKVGLTRVYLVLGVAVGPFDHPAWGLGLGTTGRPRGRFTPSLDLLVWVERGNDDESNSLTQLRPLVAWQVRRQGRLALVAGPTLNLAAADNRGSQRGSFGQHQWLWLDSSDGRGSVRFWPGVQVGVRF